ncbi:helix-hairpin-helix domain-containing protein [Catalinimonas niigatensis]|uniref:helix-hairpin-helix domain-containing protein n=1 Tax=Catalinimonas niigatensis TaxID=1397264 RepID=UPI002665D070|nr:helix-hairpin-helix domain-containing protein [Catalinimonas niigatensis]WPP51410.1 helix-hairpin-helix domain-containing protein [Catalinimonas niigatensis]
MRRISILLSFLLLFALLQASAQQVSNEVLESILEKILPTQYEDDVDVTQVYENLVQFYQEPLNLNEANADELRQLFFLSERQINNIIRYREYYGYFLSQYELALIPSLDQQSIESLLPFISIQQPQDRSLALKKRLQNADNRYLLLRQSTTLEHKKGYIFNDSSLDQRYYQGSPHNLYARMRISQPGSISLGFTLEKDAGEKIIWDKGNQKYGTDFISGHFQLENVGPVDQLTIGDYSFQAGQQLVFGSGLGLGKGALTVRSVGRSQHGVRPYTSTTESGFMRGIATSWKLPVARQHLKLTVLYSSNHRHAKIYEDPLTQNEYFRSFDISGLHRNTNELLDRKQVLTTDVGSNFHFTNRYQNFQLGLNFMHTNFSRQMIPTDIPYKKYDFTGDKHTIGSAYLSYQFQHWNSFAEVARSWNNQYGIIAGINGVLNSYLESVWLYRNYSPGFYSLYGNAFGENTRNANEEGLYWGLKIEPIAKLTLGAYYDLFRFPWLRYRVDAPSRGHEYLMRANYQLSRSTNLLLQYRLENKGINVSDDTLAFKLIGEGIRQNFAFNLDYILSERVRLKTKVHSSSYSIADSLTRGWVVAQDISCSLGRWKADARFALINTEDYNNRQYLYENDVLYAFSVPAYSGQGVSYYLLLRYKINRYVSSWARWGRTVYDDREVIGSSLEEINGNRKTQLKFQLMVNF